MFCDCSPNVQLADSNNILKSVQSTLSHCRVSPEGIQSQRNYGSFLSKSDYHGTILYTVLAQNWPKGKRQWLRRLRSELLKPKFLSHVRTRLLNMTWSNLRFNVWRSFITMATNLPYCFSIEFLEQLLKFQVNFTLLKYVKSQRSYGFLITKKLIFGFQILDLKDHFSASLRLPLRLSWRTGINLFEVRNKLWTQSATGTLKRKDHINLYLSSQKI